MSSILLQDDLQNLSQGKVRLGGSVDSGFGKSNSQLEIQSTLETTENDFARLSVVEDDGTVLLTQFIPSSKFDLDSDGRVIFNVGNHLRSFGFDQGTYNVLTDNLTVGSIIESIREIIPKININYVDSEIMNQLSYEVSSRKICKVGFEFTGSINDNIAQTISLLQLKNLETNL